MKHTCTRRACTARIVAVWAVALAVLAAGIVYAEHADAAPGGKRVVVKQQRSCYTLAGVKRCTVKHVRVVRVRGTWTR